MEKSISYWALVGAYTLAPVVLFLELLFNDKWHLSIFFICNVIAIACTLFDREGEIMGWHINVGRYAWLALFLFTLPIILVSGIMHFLFAE